MKIKLEQRTSNEDGPYYSADGHVMQREYEGVTENGNPFGGRWVLRDKDGTFIGVDQYRHDLAPRHGFIIEN